MAHKTIDDIHIAMLSHIVKMVDKHYEEAKQGTGDLRRAKKAFITELYKQFCETVVAEGNMLAMQERLSWMELTLIKMAERE